MTHAWRRLAACVSVAALSACTARGDPEPPAAVAADVRPSPVRIAPVYPLPLPTSTRIPGGVRRTAGGVLERWYGAKHNGAGWQFQPVTTTYHCLAAHRLAEEDADARADVVRTADALFRHGDATRAGVVWRYNFPNARFGMRAGWISGMAQGMAMACFAAAFDVSGEKRFLAAARHAFTGLVGAYNRGGARTNIGGGWYFEETAQPGTRPSHILNGMVAAIAGVWFTNEIDPRPEYARAIAMGTTAVAALAHRYPLPGRRSLYDLAGHVASPKYNEINATFLCWLYDLAGDARLESAARKMTGDHCGPSKGSPRSSGMTS